MAESTRAKGTTAATKAAGKVAGRTPAGRAAKVATRAGRTTGGGGGKRAAAPGRSGGPSQRPSGRRSRAPQQSRAIGSAKAAHKGATGFVSRRLSSRGALATEWLICILLIGLGFFFADDPKVEGTQVVLRFTGTCGVFLVLSLVAAGGPGARKAATGLGALVTLTFLYRDRDFFHRLQSWTTDKATKKAAGEGS